MSYKYYQACVLVDNTKVETLNTLAKSKDEAIEMTIKCYYQWYKLHFFKKYEILSIKEIEREN